MSKKLFILFAVIFLFVSLLGCESNTMSPSIKQSQRDAKAQELTSRYIEASKNLSSLEEQLEEIKNESGNYLSTDELIAFYQKMNNYCVRGTLTIEVLKREAFSFNTTSTYGSGVVITGSNGLYYAISTYDLVCKSNATIRLEDAFGTVYTGSVSGYSKDYNLAVIKFKASTDNDLYSTRLPSADSYDGMDCAMIMTSDVEALNNIKLTRLEMKEDSIMRTQSSNTKYSIGSPLFNVNGELIGICSKKEDNILTFININDIVSFLKETGFTIE